MPARRRCPSFPAAIAAALAACSVVPAPHYPPFHDHLLAADFVVPAGGELRVPSSSPALAVNELHCEPPPHAERFSADGARWLRYPAGTAVRVRGRFRAYADPTGRLPTAAELLPGAVRLIALEGP